MADKKKKLSNKDRMYIQEQLEKNEKIDDIAKDLDIEVEVVRQYLTGLFESMNKINLNNKEELKKKAAKPTIKDLMVTRTSSKRAKGVTIMTREASERTDDAKKMLNDGGAAFRQRYKDAIAPTQEE